MSLERTVFAPIERLAARLHPYRWFFFAGTLLFIAIPFALALVSRFVWPWPEWAFSVLKLGAPTLLLAVAWCWGGFLFCVWFAPLLRPESPAVGAAARVRNVLRAVMRAWALVLLAIIFVLPPILLVSFLLFP